MNIKIVSDEFELTGAIEEYVNKKLKKLKKHLRGMPDDVKIEVILRDDKHRNESGFTAEINIRTNAGGGFNAYAQAADLYAAIDMMKDSIIRELEKHHAKHRDQNRKNAKKFKERLKGWFGMTDNN